MNVIAGMSRSGTSMMCLVAKETYGDDKLVGNQFPPNFENKEMNPNGFWEVPQTAKGYHKTITDDDSDKWMKLVITGLLNSDIRLIDDIYLILRHPMVSAESRKIADFKSQSSFTPKYYVELMSALGFWVVENDAQDKINIINYEDVIKNPKVLEKYGFRSDVVDTSLNRSDKIQDKQDWREAMKVYKMAQNGDWESLRDIYKREFKTTGKKPKDRSNLAPIEQRRSRAKICSTCEFNKNNRCTACPTGGCRIAIFVASKNKKCPKGFWQ